MLARLMCGSTQYEIGILYRLDLSHFPAHRAFCLLADIFSSNNQYQTYFGKLSSSGV